MAFINLGFEDEASPTEPGRPNGWFEFVSVTPMERADWDQNDPNLTDNRQQAYESFETDWSQNAGYTFAYADPVDLTELEFALLDGGISSVEDFENLWSDNENYLFAWGSEDVSEFDGSGYALSSSEKFHASDAETMDITTNLGGPGTITVDANRASHFGIGGAGGGAGFLNGRVLRLTLNKRTVVDIAFTGAEGDIGAATTTINTELTNQGVGYEASAALILFMGIFRVLIDSDLGGYNSQIIAESGPGDPGDVLDLLGWDGEDGIPFNGSGNIALETSPGGPEALAQDFVDIINAEASVQAIGAFARLDPFDATRFNVVAPPDGFVQMTAGALETALGLGTSQHGTDQPAQNFEDFESAWPFDQALNLGAVYFITWAQLVTAALVDTAPISPNFDGSEPFEAEWSANELYQFTMGAVAANTFDPGVGGASEAFEDFEEVKAPFAFTVNVGLDLILATGHGLSVNQRVKFSVVGAGVLPAGLSVGVLYWVINVNANDFQVSNSMGGPAVTINDNGAGTFEALPDQSVWWTSIMTTL